MTQSRIPDPRDFGTDPDPRIRHTKITWLFKVGSGSGSESRAGTGFVILVDGSEDPDRTLNGQVTGILRTLYYILNAPKWKKLKIGANLRDTGNLKTSIDCLMVYNLMLPFQVPV
jgi:hypothetical protein